MANVQNVRAVRNQWAKEFIVCHVLIVCQVQEENNQFKSFQTKEQYRIRQDINCKSENVKYLVTCKRCGLQGVGLCLVLSQLV